ncbi:amino acid--[acyl-carrier-protein] ligase [Burkholderia plantarii]|uniref:Amino acid--[acyl-carrier-protein] ligase n=1 Tax=Burkholderia plantarii TaxID=41899 RepID=A0A0B6RXA1_BURPL|nr:amino acid--[acyl-carrier-protein] ligase [Burkholderia plantarii]AJK49982.1 hypothetical protein BGL_2c19160 [Burkholderia plantarii]
MPQSTGLAGLLDPASPAASPDPDGFLIELLDAGLLIATGVDGLYGRGAAFEEVVERVNGLIGRWGAGKEVEVIRFPPAMNRQILEEAGYWQHFPDQIGSVFCFSGDELRHQRLLKCLDNQEDWTEDMRPTRLAATPVACYPLYPVMAARGPLPAGGRLVDLFSYCCRHEPSRDPERMLMFRQREFVCLGTAGQVQAFREDLMAYATAAVKALQLPFSVDLASDPFFGRIGKVMADSQRQKALKYELLIAGIHPDKLTACGSFNYHTDRFGELWKIRTDDGEIAHTGCCGFGLERLALGLFRHHGFDTAAWPQAVRDALWPHRDA